MRCFVIVRYIYVQNHVTDEQHLRFLYSYRFAKFHNENVTKCFVVVLLEWHF